jgi:hypothetical protein
MLHVFATFSTRKHLNIIPVCCDLLEDGWCIGTFCMLYILKVQCCTGKASHILIFFIYISFNVFITLKLNVNVKYVTFFHFTLLSVGWDTVLGK